MKEKGKETSVMDDADEMFTDHFNADASGL